MNRLDSRALGRLVLLGAAFAAGPAAAGEPLGTDLFAGYSYLKLSGLSRNGANLALGFHAIGPVAGFVDASAHWGNDSGTSIKDWTAMAGPGVRFGQRGGTVLFARVLAGVLRDATSVSVLDVDISEGETRFAILAGGGVDVRIAAHLALRAQGDYAWYDASSGSQSGFRGSGGLVYRFGSAP